MHMTAHAFAHLGRDLNGRTWAGAPAIELDSPEDQISRSQEAIAQFYTFKLLEWLGDEQLTTAFAALENASTPAYSVWRETRDYSLEQVRAILIRHRNEYAEWPPRD